MLHLRENTYDNRRLQYMANRNVQIPEILFYRLMAYFYSTERPADPDAAELYDLCKKGLDGKYNALQVRKHYTTMHDPQASPTVREQARQAYLDSKGVPDSFRWSPSDDLDQNTKDVRKDIK